MLNRETIGGDVAEALARLTTEALPVYDGGSFPVHQHIGQPKPTLDLQELLPAEAARRIAERLAAAKCDRKFGHTLLERFLAMFGGQSQPRVALPGQSDNNNNNGVRPPGG